LAKQQKENKNLQTNPQKKHFNYYIKNQIFLSSLRYWSSPMKRIINSLIIMIVVSLLFNDSIAQTLDSTITSTSLSGIKMRSIGPAFMSGRIADIAIHPANNNIWFGSGWVGGTMTRKGTRGVSKSRLIPPSFIILMPKSLCRFNQPRIN